MSPNTSLVAAAAAIPGSNFNVGQRRLWASYGLRFSGNVRYVGWAVPEAVYPDYDVIQNAPPVVNRSGIARFSATTPVMPIGAWRMRAQNGRKWPYDQELVDEAAAGDGDGDGCAGRHSEVNEKGIRTLMTANRWGGAAYHNAGWNPRHIEAPTTSCSTRWNIHRQEIHPGSRSAWAFMSVRCS